MPRQKLGVFRTSINLDAADHAIFVGLVGKQNVGAHIRVLIRADIEAREASSAAGEDAGASEARPAPKTVPRRRARGDDLRVKRHPDYRIWKGMRARSAETGVAIWPAWDDFWQFSLDMGEREPNAVLLRQETTRPWSPTNCSWGTKPEASRTRGGVATYGFEGGTYTIPKLAAKVGIKPETLYARIAVYGWPIERAVAEPVAPGPGKSK